MSNIVGVRRETKSPWERRTPLTPRLVSRLVRESGLEIQVQSSARRVYDDSEFVRAGATVTGSLAAANVVFGVKEIPVELLQPSTTYVFFAHVIKGQSYNMPMLARLLELGCTLIDYEKVCDAEGRRLIFFGRYAGLAGMIDTLSALGQRLQWEKTANPFSSILMTHEYESLHAAKAAIGRAGEAVVRKGLPESLTPLIVGIAGYGNVAAGVREILADLPTREIQPDEVAALLASGKASNRCLYQVTYREQDIVRPRDPQHPFELTDYYEHPENYDAAFAEALPFLTILMNCNYWDARYPRLVSLDDVRRLWGDQGTPRLRIIGDISCDVDGAVQCTLKVTEPDQPVYVFDPSTGEIQYGVSGRGPVILAVDILPAELPREASEEFSKGLAPFIAAIARADYSAPFDQLALPPEIQRAVIVHRGELTPEYAPLARHLP